MKNTIAKDWGKGNVTFLEKHKISCENGFITEFKLNRPYKDLLSYKYQCCIINNIKCYNANTPFYTEQGGNTVFLDRHYVECKDGYSVSSFQLVRNPPENNKIRYNFKCCN